MAQRPVNSSARTQSKSVASRYDATLYNFFDGTKYPPNFGYSNDIVTYKLSNNQTKKVSKSIVNLIDMMFNEDYMRAIMIKYSLDPSILESNDITSDIILTGLVALSSVLSSVCKGLNGQKSKDNSNAFSRFLSTIPFINTPIINTSKEVDFYSNGLNDVLLMKDAYAIIKEYRNDPNFFYKYYKKFQTKLRPLEKNCDEYKKIFEYIQNSHGPTHNNYSLEVVEVFKISKRGDFTKYKPMKDNCRLSKLLWYGTRTTNFPSILWKGLQIPPQQTPSISEFGKGIYLTDCVSKAANNCGADRNYPHGLLLLAETAIGQTLKLTKSQDIKNLPKGKHSVKGLGKYVPNQNGHILTKNGVQVPLGKLIQDQSLTTNFNYNKYVVYNSNQILMQYLVQVNFRFK